MQLASGYEAEVERGPNWLFVRLRCDEAADGAALLCDELSALMQRHSARRMVVELDGLACVDDETARQIARLFDQVTGDGGLLRVSGATAAAQEKLTKAQGDGAVPCYATRHDAVLGHRPHQPR
ncbi:MAG: hypothetical protein KDA41_14600 [Planctomycetales bacterium]|nr:hypothetical protein [Planctomycetales bacterium]